MPHVATVRRVSRSHSATHHPIIVSHDSTAKHHPTLALSLSPQDDVARGHWPHTGLTLTPTSTPTEIYTQITSLTELRRQANLFEAALSNQQSDGDKQHSTCFKLY